MSYQKTSLSDAHNLLHTFIDNNTIQLVSILGIGAYGVVYLGQSATEKYAVKMLTHTCKEPDLHAKLSRHPNILHFKKIVYQNNKAFMILEYMPDGDLFSAITKNRENIVGHNEAIRHIFLQIIDAVQFCHENNVAHRDLKPENILLGPHLQVKLADFGLATTNAYSDEFGCGSTFYFSPECQGTSVEAGLCTTPYLKKPSNTTKRGYNTQKNDIWSLGVILINLTAGRNPWKQASLKNATFAAYVRHPRHFFRRILPCLSEELEKILLRIFCLNPARRISLSELRFRIQRCQSFVTQPVVEVHTKSAFTILHSSNHYQLKENIPRHPIKHHKPSHLHHHKLEKTKTYPDPISKTILHHV